MLCNYSFLSSLLGFIGLLITTGYGWYLSYRVKDLEKNEQRRLEGAADGEIPSIKLDIAAAIKRAKKNNDEYSSKISNRVFIILTISFGLSIGGVIMSANEGTKIEDRLSRIENYLWPSSGPGGGRGNSPTLSEQISSMSNTISRIEGLQLKIIETIYNEEKHQSELVAQQMKALTKEIEMLKMHISILKRQQGGQQGEATFEAEQ
tara:strand:+ start:113795 stop:114412 length:618 start_codon:yes stop_codon:yes gene_type:complete